METSFVDLLKLCDGILRKVENAINLDRPSTITKTFAPLEASSSSEHFNEGLALKSVLIKHAITGFSSLRNFHVKYLQRSGKLRTMVQLHHSTRNQTYLSSRGVQAFNKEQALEDVYCFWKKISLALVSFQNLRHDYRTNVIVLVPAFFFVNIMFAFCLHIINVSSTWLNFALTLGLVE